MCLWLLWTTARGQEKKQQQQKRQIYFFAHCIIHSFIRDNHALSGQRPETPRLGLFPGHVPRITLRIRHMRLTSWQTSFCCYIFCNFFVRLWLPKRWLGWGTMWLINNMPIIERKLNECGQTIHCSLSCCLCWPALWQVMLLLLLLMEQAH